MKPTSGSVAVEPPMTKSEPWIKVEPIHCHKRFPGNTLITHVRSVSRDRVHTEIRCSFNTKELTFFFDHTIDHLPGMLEAAAMRQASLVLAHLVYNVPLDYVAMLEWMNIRLCNYGELRRNTWIRSRLVSELRTSERVQLVLHGLMVQEDYPVMEVKGKLVMFSPKVAKRLRFKKARFGDEGDFFRRSINGKALDS